MRRKQYIKSEEQEPLVEVFGDLWIDGFSRQVVTPRPPRFFVYEGKKRIGELKLSISRG